jgi:prefoldin subunit 5
MRILLIVAGVVVIAALVVFQQSMGVAPGDIWAAIQGWSLAQQVAVAAIVLAFVFALAAGIWQSDRIAQQEKAIDILQKRMNGIRDEIGAAGEDQAGADAAVRHLVGTDPVAIIDDVQRRLTETETRTSQQEAQNEAIDLQTRIDEIRRRQQALRTQLGSVSEKRRTIEPMLGEVKERQGLIERTLGDVEKDESGKGIAARLEEAESFLNRGHTRLDALETALGSLKGIGERLEQLQGEIAPLKHAESGVKAMLGGVLALQTQVDVALSSLEKDEDGVIGERIEKLAKAKAEIEQRIAALTGSLGSLEAMRGDIGSQFEKLQAALDGHLKR